MMTHTKGPWTSSEWQPGEQCVYIYGRVDAALKPTVAVVKFGLSYGQNISMGVRANAARIVTAVNCHDDLVAALEKIAGGWVPEHIHEDDNEAFIVALQDMARAAVAKTKDTP